MHLIGKKMRRVAVLLLAGMLVSGAQAFADRPEWAGGKKDDRYEARERYEERYRKDDDHGRYRDDDRGRHRDDDRDRHKDRSRDDRERRYENRLYFNDNHRGAVHQYYRDHYRSGHCPPGLVRKNNRCLPPGQAKKWVRGRPLPREVIYYDVAPEILVHLGPPPPNHRFVRVAEDILLIAVGTGMVIDALEDLSNY